jgi:hypothetical protein
MRRAQQPVANPGRTIPAARLALGSLHSVRSALPDKARVAIAPLTIRSGANAWSDKLRRCARCTVCGHKSATLQVPGWVDNIVGHQPFSVEGTDDGTHDGDSRLRLTNA